MIEKDIISKHAKYTHMIIIVIGATGLVTKKTFEVFESLGIRNIEDTILKCQRSALLGTMKIVKSFMKM